MRSLHIETEQPLLTTTREKLAQKRRPSTAKNKSIFKKKELKKIGVQSTRSVTEAGSFPLYEASQMLGDLSQRFIYKAAPIKLPQSPSGPSAPAPGIAGGDWNHCFLIQLQLSDVLHNSLLNHQIHFNYISLPRVSKPMSKMAPLVTDFQRMKCL